MKNRIISVIVNALLCVVVACVCVVGFGGGGAAQVDADGESLYYRAKNPNGVSLNFNVYENTQNVYKILDILQGYSAKATFFIGGCWADDNIDCVREIANRGHEVASHGYFHKDHSRLNYSQNLAEIRPSVKLLSAMTGAEVKLFAPPSGAYNSATISAAEKLNLKTIMWSRDTIDWRDGNEQVFFERATKNLSNGEFILMHPKAVTVATLPRVLEYIYNNGLTAVTVSQNL